MPNNKGGKILWCHRTRSTSPHPYNVIKNNFSFLLHRLGEVVAIVNEQYYYITPWVVTVV